MHSRKLAQKRGHTAGSHGFPQTMAETQSLKFKVWRLRFSSDVDIVRLTNARFIIIIIIIK